MADDFFFDLENLVDLPDLDPMDVYAYGAALPMEPMEDELEPPVSFVEPPLFDVEECISLTCDERIEDILQGEIDALELIFNPRKVDPRFNLPRLFQLGKDVFEILSLWCKKDEALEGHMQILFTDYFDELELDEYRNGEIKIHFPLRDADFFKTCQEKNLPAILHKFIPYADLIIFLEFTSIGRTHMVFFDTTIPTRFALTRIE